MLEVSLKLVILQKADLDLKSFSLKLEGGFSQQMRSYLRKYLNIIKKHTLQCKTTIKRIKRKNINSHYSNQTLLIIADELFCVSMAIC